VLEVSYFPFRLDFAVSHSEQPWITPSIFEQAIEEATEQTNNSAIVDEFTFGQMQARSQALGVLQNHWGTWITEDDFVQISAAGLNHVRCAECAIYPYNDRLSYFISFLFYLPTLTPGFPLAIGRFPLRQAIPITAPTPAPTSKGRGHTY
jgi:hypothetical protein